MTTTPTTPALTPGIDSDSIIASCNCFTKTPDVQYHKTGCKYRLICERDEARAALTRVGQRIEEIARDYRIAQTDLNVARAENKRLREALDRLVNIAEEYSADQTDAMGTHCGYVQPISPEDGVELNEAIAAANGVLAAIELKELDSALIGELAESRAENNRLREALEELLSDYYNYVNIDSVYARAARAALKEGGGE